MAQTLFSNLRGDLSGGISSAIMALPGNIVYGLIAFAPLGAAYMGQGILAGIYASIFAGFFATLFGSTPGMISGPRVPTALIIASVMGQIIHSQHFVTSRIDLDTVVTLGYATVLLSGLFQILFGTLNLTRFVKYLSFPVIAGIMNGTVVIIVAGALWDYLGVDRQPLLQLLGHLQQIQWPTLLIALASTLLWLKGERLVRLIPGPALSILGGTGIYYLLAHYGYAGRIGDTIGQIPVAAVNPGHLLEIAEVAATPFYLPFLPIVVSGALIIAILSSVETMLAMLTIQNLTNQRASGNRELIGQGIGNLMNAVFGALPAGGAASRVLVNHSAGGHGKLSGYIFSLVTLAIVLLCAGFIQYIPDAVVAGMSLMVAWIVLDKWSLKLVRDLFRKQVKHRKELLLNVAIMGLVMFAAVYFDIMVAAAIGILLSMVLFVEQMSTSVIRRIFRGDRLRSGKQRHLHNMELLEEHGKRIAVMELDGILFFGATDGMVAEIDRLVAEGAVFIVLDMKRINSVDVSGVRVLRQLYQHLREKKVRLVFAYLTEGEALWQLLHDYGLTEVVKQRHLFADTDLALEYCEDRLLKQLDPEAHAQKPFTFREFFCLSDLGSEEIERLDRCIETMRFKKGDLVFEQGEIGDAAYVIVEGSAAVTIRLAETNRTKRLTTFTQGTIVGEMALLDRGVRSANVEALEDLVCYKISLEQFDRLKQEAAHIAMRIIETISEILVARLRQANSTIAELEG